MAADQPRPVWLTREQVDNLARGATPRREPLTTLETAKFMAVSLRICAAWDAAPADATQAVVSALIYSPSVNPQRVTILAPLVLRSLGMPQEVSS